MNSFSYLIFLIFKPFHLSFLHFESEHLNYCHILIPIIFFQAHQSFYNKHVFLVEKIILQVLQRHTICKVLSRFRTEKFSGEIFSMQIWNSFQISRSLYVKLRIVKFTYTMVACEFPNGTTLDLRNTSKIVASVIGKYGRSSKVGSRLRPTTASNSACTDLATSG